MGRWERKWIKIGERATESKEERTDRGRKEEEPVLKDNLLVRVISSCFFSLSELLPASRITSRLSR